MIWTTWSAVAIGAAVFVFAVIGEGRRRRGLGLPVPVALTLGAVAAVIAGVAYGLVVRRMPRAQALRVGPEGLAFTEGRIERWLIPWDAVASAGIVHPDLSSARREPDLSMLRLELDGDVPDDPSLHHHDGAVWFPLAGFDTAARLHHDLQRRIPGRVRRVETDAALPPGLSTYGPRREDDR